MQLVPRWSKGNIRKCRPHGVHLGHHLTKNPVQGMASPYGNLNVIETSFQSELLSMKSLVLASQIGYFGHECSNPCVHICLFMHVQLPGHSGCVNETVLHPKEPIIGSCGSDKQIYLGEIDPTVR